MTSQRSLRIKIRTLRSFVLFLAALTIVIAFAAPAPQVSTRQLSAKSSAASVPAQASTSVQALLPLMPGASNAGRAPASHPPKKGVGGAVGPDTPLFLPAVLYDSGGGAVSVAVADVNGDGKPDLLVANYNSGTVGVLLGNGDGTFQAATTFDAGGPDINTYSIAVADLNGDGKPDIVVTVVLNGSQHSPLRVLLGNGDGTFQPAVAYDTGGFNPYTVVAADVNGDNKLDLVVTNEFVVSILLGNGDGTFQTAVTYATGGNFADSGVVADVNGDGKPDLIVSNESGGVGVLLGNGDGTFQPAVTYGSGAFWTTVGDVNGDGEPDLVFVNSAYPNDGVVEVLLSNGDGTFRSGATYDAGGVGSWRIEMADVNGDGKPDLLVANRYSESVTVLLGNGDGTFQAASSFEASGDLWSIAVADVNGDKRPDLVVADLSFANGSEGGVGVLLNNTGIQSATSTTLASSLNPSTHGQPITFTATVTTSGPVAPTGTVNFKWGPDGIGQGTLNASGVATFTTSILKPGPYQITAVYKGDAVNLASTSAVLHQGVKH